LTTLLLLLLPPSMSTFSSSFSASWSNLIEPL